ncbi:hypothetical protein QBC35DRAFT_495491 [Podospora australis]|uniref:Kelch repeat-containing protein n=1 Tax=Podospora australis TaxID=1536484 RepID=A0AAN7AJB3_9PEZI|nr:hypothetical protein QBC35DRAFT_495491 [Podospora australis]
MPYYAQHQLPKGGSFQSDPPQIPSTTHQQHPSRPKFHHRCTNDRIREGSARPYPLSMLSMTGKIRKDRKSVFKELGLDTTDETTHHSPSSYTSEHEFGQITGLSSPTSPSSTINRSAAPDQQQQQQQHQRLDTQHQNQDDDDERKSETGTATTADSLQSPPTSPTSATSSRSNRPWYTRLTPLGGRTSRPRVRTVSSAPPPSVSATLSFTRFSAIALLIAVVIPAFSYYQDGGAEVALNGAEAGVVYQRAARVGPVLEVRADSPTKACKRWAHQAAQLNGTLYIYGGQASDSPDQNFDAWNNNLLALDLTKSWDISSPALKGLTQPAPGGPPAVSLGHLWNDYNNLYLYGGQFSDKPFVEPAPESLWRYSISQKTWEEFKSPKTSAGKYSTDGDLLVQRAAEGAGISVPELGLSWYFGGHLDMHTTPGWSNQIARKYLKSLLEFTHPTYTNDDVWSLSGKGAPEGGVFRNITEGGLQTKDAFSERADAVLVYVPGWGKKGVLIGLAGGVQGRFIDDLSVLDVFDIATSEWYHQKTTGEAPSVRVNLCAVTASAPDASSFQVYVYGGQNLEPYLEQIQYNDMYILSIPSFTWIKVDQSGQNAPKGRAGHTCHLRDGQMIVVGGYTGEGSPCESPGIWVFNATSLKWQSRFSALSHPPDLSPENSVLASSFGYLVPAPVAKVIGGSPQGSATATTPAAGSATGGPFATGKPPVFTITQSGNTATVTQWGPGATIKPDGSSPSPGDPSSSSSTHEDRKGGLIAAGIIAGLAGLAAAYLGYCTWLYRRQVRAYRTHLAVANRYSPAGASTGGFGGSLAAFFGRKGSKKSTKSQLVPEPYKGAGTSAAVVTEKQRLSTETADSLNWATMATEPRHMFDDVFTGISPGSGSGSSMSQSQLHQPPVRPAGWWRDGGQSSSNAASGSATTPGTGGGRERESGSGVGVGRGRSESRPPERRSESSSGGSISSAERLLDGHEPSFFSVVMKPRRALRVVNGLEETGGE